MIGGFSGGRGGGLRSGSLGFGGRTGASSGLDDHVGGSRTRTQDLGASPEFQEGAGRWNGREKLDDDHSADRDSTSKKTKEEERTESEDEEEKKEDEDGPEKETEKAELPDPDGGPDGPDPKSNCTEPRFRRKPDAYGSTTSQGWDLSANGTARDNVTFTWHTASYRAQVQGSSKRTNRTYSDFWLTTSPYQDFSQVNNRLRGCAFFLPSWTAEDQAKTSKDDGTCTTLVNKECQDTVVNAIRDYVQQSSILLQLPGMCSAIAENLKTSMLCGEFQGHFSQQPIYTSILGSEMPRDCPTDDWGKGSRTSGIQKQLDRTALAHNGAQPRWDSSVNATTMIMTALIDIGEPQSLMTQRNLWAGANVACVGPAIKSRAVVPTKDHFTGPVTGDHLSVKSLSPDNPGPPLIPPGTVARDLLRESSAPETIIRWRNVALAGLAATFLSTFV